MLELKKVAVTGNLYSGKTTVCQLLQKHGAFVLNADHIVHELLKKPHIKQSVADLFGTSSFDENGNVDRKKLSKIAFQDNYRLKKLEHLLHPLVFEEIQQAYQVRSLGSSNNSLFVVEVPLLFEAGLEHWFDWIILVVANENLRKERFQAQGKTHEDFALRNLRQMDPMIAKKSSHEVVVNEDDLIDLEKQVLSIIKRLKA
jgi:dephospho-CoA kinase